MSTVYTVLISRYDQLVKRLGDFNLALDLLNQRKVNCYCFMYTGMGIGVATAGQQKQYNTYTILQILRNQFTPVDNLDSEFQALVLARDVITKVIESVQIAYAKKKLNPCFTFVFSNHLMVNMLGSTGPVVENICGSNVISINRLNRNTNQTYP